MSEDQCKEYTEKPCWICKQYAPQKCLFHSLRPLVEQAHNLEYKCQDLDQNRSEWEKRAIDAEATISRQQKTIEELVGALDRVMVVRWCECDDPKVWKRDCYYCQAEQALERAGRQS